MKEKRLDLLREYIKNNNSVSLEANIISERLAFSISIFKYIKITKDQKKNSNCRI